MLKKKVYIKKIELIDFESHKHSIFDNFSEGFNCICGESDSGKTSVFRALMLCAYNDFNKESIRVGADFCNVTVTTNLGSVNVKRGKGVNLWTITKEGSKTPIVFDKVGTSPVEEACAVLGMRMIKLGDIEIPVNIMSQLERHFLISSIGDEKTSGSGRAEIIDEICGLNGTEELVKTISLDQYRLTREVTVLEERSKELAAKLNSEFDLQQDIKNLEFLERLEEQVNISKENQEYVKNLLDTYNFNFQKHQNIKNKIKLLPSTKESEELIKEVVTLVSKLEKMTSIKNDFKNTSEKLVLNKSALERTPLIDTLNFDKCREIIEKLKQTKNIQEDFYFCKNRKIKIAEKIKELTIVSVEEEILKSKELLRKINECKSLLKSYKELNEKIVKIKEEIDKKQKQESIINTEITELYKNIDICPVTKKIITEQCSLWDFKE